MVALPQIVEFLRILPMSLRGHRGFGDWRLSVGALRPVHAIEWLVPLAFGRYDLMGEGGMWGASLFEGKLPIYLSLYPGLLSLVLVASSGRPRSRAAWWAWGMVGAGLFFALGGHNPVAAWLLELPGGSAFRYPIKVWPLVAVGASLLCGIGFQRTVGRAIGSAGEEAPRLRLPAAALGVLALFLVGIGLVLVLAPERFEAVVAAYAPASWPGRFAVVERLRWMATIVVSCALLGGLAAGFTLSRTRPFLGAAFLLALQAVGQVFFLHSLVATDEVRFYQDPPPSPDRGRQGRSGGPRRLSAPVRPVRPDDRAGQPALSGRSARSPWTCPRSRESGTACVTSWIDPPRGSGRSSPGSRRRWSRARRTTPSASVPCPDGASRR